MREELEKEQRKLDKLTELQQELKGVRHFSLESIADIAHVMENRKNLSKVHITMLVTGIPFSLLEVGAIILWIVTGIWWPAVVYLAAVVPYGIWVSRYYFSRVAYICPQCHETFRPKFKEAFFARHTPHTRKLTCTACGHHGFCVETWEGK